MRVFINNTRTFKQYLDNYHHHDLMLANGCMAACYDEQEYVDKPSVGDVVAIYASKLGVVAFGSATNETAYLNDDRVGRHPTKIRKLKDFRLIAFPIRSNEYATSNSMTISEVVKDTKGFLDLLYNRALPPSDPTLFK
ncbi:MAG: hypothetical protein H6822_27290 [Planctomycetaceae bacterium]|nr:hypothetical protein [Planctomycetaceae bacterium]